MSWTTKQRQTFAVACKRAGIPEDHRKLILRQFDGALYDERGRATGEPSSRSRYLNNSDFEQAMAVVEKSAGGQVPGFSPEYWQEQSVADLQRFRHRILQYVDQLERAGLLYAGGRGLQGWIRKRVDSQTDRIEDLDYHGLRALYDGLRAYGQRHGQRVPA